MEVVVFTNGCFDILHAGHIDLLQKAKNLGTKLIVGINSDESVRAIKGYPRPFVSENDRADVLMGLKSVDEVVIFSEPTPQLIIEKIRPNILVKGGDWSVNQIIGADFVKNIGGQVFSIPLKEGYSTSSIVQRIEESFSRNINKIETVRSSNEIGFSEHLWVIQNLLDKQKQSIELCGKIIAEAFENRNKIWICGSRESIDVAKYLAKVINRLFQRNSKEISVIALPIENSVSTTLDNDFENVYKKQVDSLCVAGDVLIGISNSGNSTIVISAIMQARLNGCKTIGLTGAKGKKLASLCDSAVLVDSERSTRIHEAIITISNLWCENF